MGKYFNQITREERIVINHLLQIGVSKAKIAEQLEFHRSTIYREVERLDAKRLEQACEKLDVAFMEAGSNEKFNNLYQQLIQEMDSVIEVLKNYC